MKYSEYLPSWPSYLQINLGFEDVIHLGHRISSSNWKKTDYTEKGLRVRVKTDDFWHRMVRKEVIASEQRNRIC
ncbi:hypothetical protein GCM10011328_37620 [Hafnia psychrotolerans]|uniref:Uncharacterized protein n=1 Tax=Hafnia psychrotolerans TaxID=1477018 RepID=A0ABQ1H4S3_9GAMM|nr:hypothetical protein GCM10011328_37620 [Hafnia psychrotolerans]